MEKRQGVYSRFGGIANMKQETIFQQLKEILIDDELLLNEPLSRWTTWKVGGPVEYLVFPGTAEKVSLVIKIAKTNDIPIAVLGNGSNVLVKDKGIKGIVINTSKLQKSEVKETSIFAEAGVIMPVLAKHALQNSLTGLEFSVGIPASFGGAILMNAGAWGKSIGEIIKEVKVVNMEGEIKTLSRGDMVFKYRESSFKKGTQVIVGGSLELIQGDPVKIKNLMNFHQKSRLEKQPLRLPNAGSVFKNPEGYAAGYLIESVGLKGFSIGGAQISDKHANFIVNTGNATAEDILNLMERTIQCVENFYGIHLEPEVSILG